MSNHWNPRIPVGLRTIPPLPEGKGRGEGERMLHFVNQRFMNKMSDEILVALGYRHADHRL